jgi:hypothetical protein
MFIGDKVKSTATVIVLSYPTMADQVKTPQLSMTSLLESKQKTKLKILHVFI